MRLKLILEIAEIFFGVYGTYLLSRQLFIETLVEQFKRNLLNYKKYEDVSLILRFAGRFYRFRKDNWINADTSGPDRPINKLSDPAAPFKGFLCICVAAIFQIIAFFPVDTAEPPLRFQNLLIKEQFLGNPTPVDLSSSTKARRFRTVLKEGAKTGPNFAGHYTVVKWGCGTACAEFAIVDAKNGRVYFPTSIKFNSYALVHDGTEPFQYQKDSALFVIAGEPDEADKLGVYYYKWTGTDLKLLHKVERTFEPK